MMNNLLLLSATYLLDVNSAIPFTLLFHTPHLFFESPNAWKLQNYTLYGISIQLSRV